ncbi:MAG: alpha/beta hydrolase [Thermoleophilaceae bacterium]
MTTVELQEETPLEVTEVGDGNPLLVLHGGGGPQSCAAIVERLAAGHRVLAPTHPGFAGTARPDWIDTVDDLAYLYLDLLDHHGLEDVTLVGCSLGGWIAAEMAVRDRARIGRLVLVDAVGIRVGARDERDVVDIFATSAEEVRELAFHDPAAGEVDYASMDQADVEALLANEEALALYAWRPYMHNPKLRRRLARVKMPTLIVWGESDRIVSPDYGRAFAAAIPDARFELLAGAGHAPQVEQPEGLCELIAQFASRAA